MSRPKLYERAIKIRLPQEDLASLTSLSKEHGVPLADLVRACVRRALPYVLLDVRKNRPEQAKSASA
jgi:type IV secretory pathway ATPase VirB11/archaellum biosynthesis ATPase